MSLIDLENWDSYTPPSLSSAWNLSSGAPFETVAGATDGSTPTSSPNMLEFPPTTGTFYCTYNVQTDLNGGNCSVAAWMTAYIATSNTIRIGLTARGSASTLGSGTSTYAAYLDFAAGTAGVSKIVGGTETVIASVTAHLAFLAGTIWYYPLFTLTGTTLSLAVHRASDGYYLASNGLWTSSPTTAVSTTDSSISGAGYAGIYAVGSSSGGTGFTDDWQFSGAVSGSGLRPFILVSPVPYQHFPYYSE